MRATVYLLLAVELFLELEQLVARERRASTSLRRRRLQPTQAPARAQRRQPQRLQRRPCRLHRSPAPAAAILIT